MAGDEGGTLRAVIAAFLGNLAIAITKGVAAVMTGSGAMLAETAHSIADAMNQLLLFIGVRRSVRAPSERHPLGHGKERYFWCLVVALLLFFGGGVFSLFEARERFEHPHEVTQAHVAFIVLGLSVVFELFSLGAALREVRHAAKAEGVPVRRFLRELRDPALRTVLFEDSAALVGLVFAIVGLALTVSTGDHRWDAVSSAAIGVLLVVVALALAADARVLIIGEAPPEATRDRLRRALLAQPDVEGVTELLAVRMGARQLLVMARLSVRDDLSGAEVERLIAGLRERLKREPEVMEAFLEVNPMPSRATGR
jgi:cation diffusion facilitator family transporter